MVDREDLIELSALAGLWVLYALLVVVHRDDRGLTPYTRNDTRSDRSMDLSTTSVLLA